VRENFGCRKAYIRQAGE
jgi:hypothetical protein